MTLYRIGEKIIDPNKINRTIERILKMRGRGSSQQEVARQFKVDRTFISRLERLGEVRKGSKIGIIGFPLANKEEIKKIAQDRGFDYLLLMDDEERWQFVKERSGMEFFNEIMDIFARLKGCDMIIVIGSAKWVNLAEGFFENKIFHIDIGESPISSDVYLEPEEFSSLLNKITKSKQGSKIADEKKGGL